MSDTETKISMIVASASNGAIGKNNQLLWHLPNDLQYFKATTMGKPIIMGRNTYESIGRPLPGRVNIVVSTSYNQSTPDVASGGIKLAPTLQEAIEIAKGQALIDGVDEIMVIGGAQIYNAAAELAERIYLTKVHAEIDGDTYFQLDDATRWNEVSRQDFQACDKNPYDYSFCVLEKQ